MVENEMRQREGLLLPMPRGGLRFSVVLIAARRYKLSRYMFMYSLCTSEVFPVLWQTSWIHELEKRGKCNAKPVHVLSKTSRCRCLYLLFAMGGKSGEENLCVLVSSRVIMTWQHLCVWRQQWDYRCIAQFIFSRRQENRINNAFI